VKGIINTAVPRDRLLCADHGRAAISARRADLAAPHVQVLTKWVESVRERLDPCHAETVCDFDPAGGGIKSRVMYLAQDPSSTASETGFISPDNNDATARATTEACAEAGLGPHDRIHWNVYPWWLKAPCQARVPEPGALSSRFLSELLVMLPDVVSVVLIGGAAERSWERLEKLRPIGDKVRVWAGPHPSYGWWGKPFKPANDGRLGRDVVVDALRAARAHACAIADR
jgi:uracil-DNA glycosylase